MARYGCTSPSHFLEYGKRQSELEYMRDMRYSLWRTFNRLPGYDQYDNGRKTFWEYAPEGTKKRSLDDNDVGQAKRLKTRCTDQRDEEIAKSDKELHDKNARWDAIREIEESIEESRFNWGIYKLTNEFNTGRRGACTTAIVAARDEHHACMIHPNRRNDWWSADEIQRREAWYNSRESYGCGGKRIRMPDWYVEGDKEWVMPVVC
jgi:hypothetical protein